MKGEKVDAWRFVGTAYNPYKKKNPLPIERYELAVRLIAFWLWK